MLGIKEKYLNEIVPELQKNWGIETPCKFQKFRKLH